MSTKNFITFQQNVEMPFDSEKSQSSWSAACSETHEKNTVQSAQIFTAHRTEFGEAAEVRGEGKLSLDRAELP